jgi:2-polyprenyl-3-methyl-5-hydroxy-6-metoxy-1,4-benzoquinol methylase
MITIDNSLKLNGCPCCNSKQLSYIGRIEYSKNTTYANSQVTLKHLPELWQCDECGSWFTQNIISENTSIELYSNGDSWISERLDTSRTDEIIRLVKSLIIPESKLLDIGCSNGALLDFFKEHGMVTHGIEYSSKNRTILKNKGHLTYASWSEVSEKFEIITAFDVIEHLYDIKMFFDFCRNHLLPGGLLVIMTGNISSVSAEKARQSWWYLRYPEHIVFPSKKYYSSLENLSLVSFNQVYPYKFYNKNFIQRAWESKNVKLVLKSSLSGLFDRQKHFPSPSRPPDHSLIILKQEY